MIKKYDINKLTINDVKELIANGNDNIRNQIRVTKDGEVYLSTIVGNRDRENIQFALETLGPFSGDVGIQASNDPDYIKRLYKIIKYHWDNKLTYYIYR